MKTSNTLSAVCLSDEMRSVMTKENGALYVIHSKPNCWSQKLQNTVRRTPKFISIKIIKLTPPVPLLYLSNSSAFCRSFGLRPWYYNVGNSIHSLLCRSTHTNPTVLEFLRVFTRHTFSPLLR